MKNILVFALTVTSAGLLIYGSHRSVYGSHRSQHGSHRSLPATSPSSNRADQAPGVPEVLPAVRLSPERERRLKNINEQVRTLTAQLQDVDHELNRAGFPKVFLDARLTAAERTRLLSKVEQSSRLQNRIAQLKIRQIDLSASETL